MHIIKETINNVHQQDGELELFQQHCLMRKAHHHSLNRVFTLEIINEINTRGRIALLPALGYGHSIRIVVDMPSYANVRQDCDICMKSMVFLAW
jgi:hypothetical protein